MIGIWGMGGGGKTTLARAVFDSISNCFEAKCFIENVRECSKGSGLKELQKFVLQNMLIDKSIHVESVYDGKSQMEKKMHRKKILVVLDDVDDIGQLEALAPDLSWFQPGSRIIITTRDEQVLKAHQVNIIHNTCLLSQKEAICLLSRYAFGREIPNQGYEELSRMIVHYAAGLPLTIKVLGLFLYGRIEGEWKDTIKRLQTIPLRETLEKLELSYNGLENDQKEIFLDIACILKGEKKKHAIRVLESHGFCAQIGLRVLEQKSLITLSKDDDDDDDILLLHDHIEEMGMNIVRRLNPHEPKRHSRLWIRGETEDILVNESGTEEIKCIKLVNTNLDPTIIEKGIGKMKELRFLEVLPNHGLRKFNEVGQYLPDSLQSLCWVSYPFRSLPESFQANKLINLEMVWSKISKLWEGGEGKVLNNLRFLDLRNSKLKTFDLTMTPHLEELNLEGCSDFVELQFPVNCPNLKFLYLSDSKVSNLNLGMTPHLEKLIFHACNEFELHMPFECPELRYLKLKGAMVSNLNLGLTPHLERLYLTECYLQNIHAPVGCLKKLVHVHLDCCSSFVKFTFYKQYNSPDLDSVATLEIDAQCVRICQLHLKTDLPVFSFKCIYDEPGSSWSGNLEKLLSTGLCDCKNIEYLSAAICGLQHLRELTLKGSIPGDLWKLDSLEKLSLWESGIQHLPDSICMLKNLKSLAIDLCLGIERLPENICRLNCLETLAICNCPSLRDISNICNMKYLKSLKLFSCIRVEKLPENLERLECLEVLELAKCVSLREIPNSIRNMKCLKRLDLSYCDQVKQLPEKLGRLECLKELNIDGAGISRLPLSIYRLHGMCITVSKEQLESYGLTPVTKQDYTCRYGQRYYCVEL